MHIIFFILLSIYTLLFLSHNFKTNALYLYQSIPIYIYLYYTITCILFFLFYFLLSILFYFFYHINYSKTNTAILSSTEFPKYTQPQAVF